MPKIKTGGAVTQNIKEYLDVDCWAEHEGDDALWTARVWLDKESGNIVFGTVILFSPDAGTQSEETETVPADIALALAQLLHHAANRVLVPARRSKAAAATVKAGELPWLRDCLST